MVRTDVEVIATDYMFSFLSANRTSYTCASPPGLELIQPGGKTCSDRPTGLLRSAQKFKLRKGPLKVIRGGLCPLLRSTQRFIVHFTPSDAVAVVVNYLDNLRTVCLSTMPLYNDVVVQKRHANCTFTEEL